MSGVQYLANNNIQFHAGYGLRKETTNVNMSIFAGLTYYYGVVAVLDSAQGTIPRYYQGTGIYAAAQIIKKFSYDIGAGIEIFTEYSKKQQLFGVKFVLFFSGAYKGAKQNFNPNVRSENKK